MHAGTTTCTMGHTVRYIADSRLTAAKQSWKENIPVKQPVDVSGAASPGGGSCWTPARIWRKKLNPVHTLQADIDDGFDPWKMDRSRTLLGKHPRDTSATCHMWLGGCPNPSKMEQYWSALF